MYNNNISVIDIISKCTHYLHGGPPMNEEINVKLFLLVSCWKDRGWLEGGGGGGEQLQ